MSAVKGRDIFIFSIGSVRKVPRCNVKQNIEKKKKLRLRITKMTM